MARSDYAQMILNWVGSDKFKVIDPATGWPSTIEWDRDGTPVRIALHLAPASPHSRKEYEWRFQNPAGNKSPVRDDAGYPILMGFDESADPPILVIADGTSRVGRLTRFPILFNRGILDEARAKGVSLYVSNTDEERYAFRPKLLSSVLEVVVGGVTLPPGDLTQAAITSGFSETNSEDAAERTRRAAQVLVRDRKFSVDVRRAYGDTCAMCGLGIGLTVGAHIYPVSAPASADVTQNGVSLCQNHHAAYDNYDVWFEAETYTVSFSPRLLEAAKTSEAVATFIENTVDVLILPDEENDTPAKDWIDKRRDFYMERYDWLG